MVDLIPAEYRQRVQIRRLLHGFGWCCLALLLVFGISYAALVRALNSERAALARSRQMLAQDSARLARLRELRAQEQNVSRKLRALAALRAEAPIEPLFDAIDAALNARLWFSELDFSRAEEAGAAAPAGAPVARAGRAEIRGIAADHAALAQFIDSLGRRPDVIEVRLRDSSMRSYPGFQVVDFHLTAQIGPTAGAAP